MQMFDMKGDVVPYGRVDIPYNGFVIGLDGATTAAVVAPGNGYTFYITHMNVAQQVRLAIGRIDALNSDKPVYPQPTKRAKGLKHAYDGGVMAAKSGAFRRYPGNEKHEDRRDQWLDGYDSVPKADVKAARAIKDASIKARDHLWGMHT